jgi:LysR family hca operon transcriptional activator
VELPYLDLYVSYHKNNKCYVVSKFLELLTRVFYLDINRSEQN